MTTRTRIVLFDDGGGVLFSGRSLLSEPPVAERDAREDGEMDEPSPETLPSPRSILPTSRRSEPVPVEEVPLSRTHAA